MLLLGFLHSQAYGDPADQQYQPMHVDGKAARGETVLYMTQQTHI